MPLILIGGLIFAFTNKKAETIAFLKNEPQLNSPASFVTSLNAEELSAVKQLAASKGHGSDDTEAFLSNLNNTEYKAFVDEAKVSWDKNMKADGHCLNTRFHFGYL